AQCQACRANRAQGNRVAQESASGAQNRSACPCRLIGSALPGAAGRQCRWARFSNRRSPGEWRCHRMTRCCIWGYRKNSMTKGHWTPSRVGKEKQVQAFRLLRRVDESKLGSSGIRYTPEGASMITLLGSPRRCCDGITRRETLKVGALSLLGGFFNLPS